MRRWGIVITALYALILIALLFPLGTLLAGGGYREPLRSLFTPESVRDDRLWLVWLLIGLMVAAQAALLFVPVDRSRERPSVQSPIAISISAATFAFGLLTFAFLTNVLIALVGDDVFMWQAFWLGAPALWLVWGVVFYLYRERTYAALDRTMGWLLRGSVLELIVAVPTHILVRHRGDCSAPLVSGYGIATGIALMLLAFGPSVLFLYQRRLADYGGHDGPALPVRSPLRTVAATLAIGTLALLAFLPLAPVSTAGGSVDLRAPVDDLRDELGRLVEDRGMQLVTLAGYLRMECGGRNAVEVRYDAAQDSATLVSYEVHGAEFAHADDYLRFTATLRERLGELAVPGTHRTTDRGFVFRWVLAWRPGGWISGKCRLG